MKNEVVRLVKLVGHYLMKIFHKFCHICIFGLFMSFGVFSQPLPSPLNEANDFSAYVFGNFEASSGNANGALAVGGNLSLGGYSVATKESATASEYSLLIEGDARYTTGRIYRGKVRVAGDIAGISQSVIWGLPAGTEIENTALSYSIKESKSAYIELSEEVSMLETVGSVEFKWGGLYLKGDGESPIQVFQISGEQLSKAHTFSVKNIPEGASLVFNVDGSQVRVQNLSFSDLIPHRSKSLFNFYQAQTLSLGGVSIEGSVLAPAALVSASSGNLMGTVIAQSWTGAMHLGGVRFDGEISTKIEVDITSPETLTTVGSSPILVKGTVSANVSTLTINGVAIEPSGKLFEAYVELEEGFNTVVARATNRRGDQITDSISVSLDLTPPYITVDSHVDGQIVHADRITVTGLVNDIVRGTVEAQQARVVVNGQPAEVSNRSYASTGVKLEEGENALSITAVDQAGNTATIERTIFYEVLAGARLEVVAGQNQSGVIGQNLSQDLVVRVIDSTGEPVVGESVIFRVVQGSGTVSVDNSTYTRALVAATDAQGLATVAFKLGHRTGVLNHKVQAKTVGYDNELSFAASAHSLYGNKISVNSGNNQRGVVGQPLPAPFIVAVTDEGANTVKGARVEFRVIKGEGVFQNEKDIYSTVTDADGRASAQLTLGDLVGLDAQRVQAVLIDGPEGQSLTAGFMASAFIAADPGKTSISGVILNNQDKPIPGVTVRIEKTDRTVTSDYDGRFVLEQVPVGPVHLIADGSTAWLSGEYPTLSYHIVTVAGVDNPLASPIYMVKLDTENAMLAGSEDVVLTLDNYPGFKLEIAKDSVTFPDGSREGYVSVTSVNSATVPMAPPNGMQPQFIVTIQPAGTKFWPPAKLSLPNVDGHEPGSQVEMYSYDHDLEEFVSIGLGTVSEDASTLTSNPGVGVVKAGWHCGSQPGGSGTAHNCPLCQKCENDTCVEDPAQANNPLPPEMQVEKDCQTLLCKGAVAAPEDLPEDDKKGDCKSPVCLGTSVGFEVNDSDISPEDTVCATCKEGEKIPDVAKEGLSCWDGSDPNKACFTCKDGSCGNHCNAKKYKDILTVGVPDKVDNWFDAVRQALNAINRVLPVKAAADITGQVTMEQGEACCSNCSATEPVIKNKYEGQLEVKGSMSVTGPFNLPSYSKYFDAGSRIYIGAYIGPYGEVSLAGAPYVNYEELLGCEEDNCFELGTKIGGSGEIGLKGEATAAYQEWNMDGENCRTANIELRKQPQKKHCWEVTEIVGADGSVKGGIKTGAEIQPKYNSCGGGSCKYKVEPLEALAHAKLTFHFLFVDLDYQWKPDPYQIANGIEDTCF
ncbi:choice-of-anchor A family protein [Vibrio vulnificus]